MALGILEVFSRISLCFLGVLRVCIALDVHPKAPTSRASG